MVKNVRKKFLRKIVTLGLSAVLSIGLLSNSMVTYATEVTKSYYTNLSIGLEYEGETALMCTAIYPTDETTGEHKIFIKPTTDGVIETFTVNNVQSSTSGMFVDFVVMEGGYKSKEVLTFNLKDGTTVGDQRLYLNMTDSAIIKYFSYICNLNHKGSCYFTNEPTYAVVGATDGTVVYKDIEYQLLAQLDGGNLLVNQDVDAEVLEGDATLSGLLIYLDKSALIFTPQEEGNLTLRVAATEKPSVYKDVTLIVKTLITAIEGIPETVTIGVGETYQFNPVLTPTASITDYVRYSVTGDSDIVSLNTASDSSEFGLIKGLSVGETEITIASTTGDIVKTCKVVVRDNVSPDIKGVDQLIANDEFSVTLTVRAEDNASTKLFYSLDGLTWQESNEFVVTDNGTQVIYVKDESENISTKIVTVSGIKEITGLKMLTPETTLEVDDTLQIEVEVVKTAKTRDTILYSLDTEGVVDITETGIVTALAEGDVTVTAALEGTEYTASVLLHVNPVDEDALPTPEVGDYEKVENIGDIELNGQIIPVLLNVTLPTKLDFIINSNTDKYEDMFIAPVFKIFNKSSLEIDVEVEEFVPLETSTHLFTDVDKDTFTKQEWVRLSPELSMKYIALRLKAVDAKEWVNGKVSEVQAIDTNKFMGSVPAFNDVSVTLAANHGTALKDAVCSYRSTFIFSFSCDREDYE
jgi:hypothetical protein